MAMRPDDISPFREAAQPPFTTWESTRPPPKET